MGEGVLIFESVALVFGVVGGVVDVADGVKKLLKGCLKTKNKETKIGVKKNFFTICDFII